MVVEEIDVKISDDSQELEILEKEINNLYTDINFFYDRKKIPQNKYNRLRDRIEDLIYAVGDLSIPYFRISNDLRDYYIKLNNNNPEKGRDDFLSRYEELHEPYNKLKNKCYVLFRKIEKIKIVD